MCWSVVKKLSLRAFCFAVDKIRILSNNCLNWYKSNKRKKKNYGKLTKLHKSILWLLTLYDMIWLCKNRMKRGIILKQYSEILKNITMLSQLGLSLMTPLLLCLGICWVLTVKLGIGVWIYILGFFFGLGGSATVAYKFYLSINRDQKKKDKKHKVYFNRHL